MPPLLVAPAASPSKPIPQGSRRLLVFAAGSGGGLVCDLVIFSVLNLLGLPAVAANLVSTAAAISVTYALVTRHAFGARATGRTYAAFFTWYGSSALVVSTAIQVLGDGDPRANLVFKIAFIPATFTTNYLFSRWLFRRSASGYPAAAGPERSLRGRSEGLPTSGLRALWGFAQRRPWTTSVALTTLYCVFIFPLNNAMSFSQPSNFSGIFRAQLTRIAFALCLACLIRWGIRFTEGVIRRDPLYRRWLTASFVHLVLLLPVFVALYPGHWVFDEFDTIYGATHFFPTAWQGYLTHVYYAFCLYLLPSAVGIVVVQMCFICISSGYLVAVIAGRIRRPMLAGIALVPLLTPAVLLNDFYPLRLTAYGYLMLLVLVHLLRRAGEPRSTRLGEFVALACAVAVLAFWRSEGVLALALLPVSFVVLGLRPLVRSAPLKLLGALTAAALAVGFSGWLNQVTADPKYRFTAMINPLSTMLQHDLQSPRLQQDLAAIDSVIDIERLRSMPSYTETPALWAAGLRPGAPDRTREFTAAYADLVINNPGPFLENRWNAYLAANTQTDWVPQVQSGGINGSASAPAEKFAAFEKSTLFGYAWDLQVKHQTARRLFLLDASLHPTAGTRVVWNASVPIAILAFALALGVFRRRWPLAACAGVALGTAALVFLTEPASYFMYFFPTYLLGLSAAGTGLALIVDHALRSRGAGATRIAGLSRGSRALVRPKGRNEKGSRVGRSAAALTDA